MNNPASIGQPLDRVDGPLKVTGKAPYAAEHQLPQQPLIGWIVEASIPKGRIKSIATQAAEKSSGVVAVLTHHNSASQTPPHEPEEEGRFTQSRAMLFDDHIPYHGFPVALVIADTLVNARHAAKLMEVSYESAETTTRAGDEADEIPSELDGGMEPDITQGDFEQAYQGSEVTLDVTYTTPHQAAAAMEPHATIADFDGSQLKVYISAQLIGPSVQSLATTLKLDQDKVRVMSPYIGGGFGSKLGVHNEAVLACLGAMHLQRPVKVAQHRRHVFQNAPHRGNSIQHIRLGAGTDGQIRAIGHESFMPRARGYEFAEPTGASARTTYRTDALKSLHRVKQVDMPPCDSCRAPGHAIGSLAFESAIDELAYKCGQDPLAFRLANMPDKDPSTGQPFASHDLAACLKEGAEKFGWKSDGQEPGTRTEGRHLVGYGVASSIRVNMLMPSKTRIRLDSDGTLTAWADMTDIGTGTYTILTQIAAEGLGLAAENVRIELGDSTYPDSSGSGGSFGAGSSGSALHDACLNMRKKLLDVAREQGLVKDAPEEDARFEDGNLHWGDQTLALTDLVRQSGSDALEMDGEVEPGDDQENYSQQAYGAQFAEVHVDRDTGEVRVKRLLGVFSAGRILNHKTARSQILGGMVWGISYALLEELMLDERYGAFMNRDLAEYHLPVNRDVPALEVHFREEPDPRSNPLGSKGIGELSICGAGAAVANAVYNATGVRVRDFPITLDKVLEALP
ncbi:xanthine dehydrogenase family protein molybdopterin-binding subunit [Marinobacter nanhaiticus D15-8W]|uniref:Xanthine dehydrogenase family protein molybdopterin-binding subunit n=1 Tax=Marinobacter nanhaiticus D15-8W TaxID=626887 RepID=N6WMR8_9GAMM|nr:xanthine dehydrogenase family protein molybdopterin-binding subunit [Marinobacter nanhaiticus]ENO12746.1 xanthine dehydrogenase family protein molybdopterin-binding subunit [Marinobacter nanhaiticus D15-8W]BES70093.1 xanthine dehydrogenase family protein molybdopterin-binding subunit [Marinobacter nanhaiticus D15-8W]